MIEDRARDLLERIDDTAEAVTRRPLSWEELDQLRCASRRLRRAIEVRTISTSARCPACEQMFVPRSAGDACCSEECREATGVAERSR